MLKKYSVVIVAAILLLGGVAAAQEASYSFGYAISKDASGALRLRITTNETASGMWLGLSLYRPGVKNAKEAAHRIYPLKQGREITDIIIEPKFENGTFEAAVWSKKLTRQECDRKDELCRRLGYRMSGMSSYLWGHLSAP